MFNLQATADVSTDEKDLGTYPVSRSFLRVVRAEALTMCCRSLEAHAAHSTHTAHITTWHTAASWLVFSKFAYCSFGCQQQAGN